MCVYTELVADLWNDCHSCSTYTHWVKYAKDLLQISDRRIISLVKIYSTVWAQYCGRESEEQTSMPTNTNVAESWLISS